MTNQHRVVTSDEDLVEMRAITANIVGEICLRAALSYGDELRLDIGALVPYPGKSATGQEVGAWIVLTRATPWVLFSGTASLTSSNDQPSTITEHVRMVEGTTITAFEIRYPDLALIIAFGTQLRLQLQPTRDEDDQDDLPSWELLTPNAMLLKVGAGPVWSYLRADRAEAG